MVISRRNIGLVGIVTVSTVGMLFIITQTTNLLQWDIIDFGIIFVLLFVGGLVYDLVFQNVQNKMLKCLLAILIPIAVLLIWAELAVGLFH